MCFFLLFSILNLYFEMETLSLHDKSMKFCWIKQESNSVTNNFLFMQWPFLLIVYGLLYHQCEGYKNTEEM